jgi:hypothetical protein
MLKVGQFDFHRGDGRPADYCQLELISTSSGFDLETDRKRNKWFSGKALIRKARESDHITLPSQIVSVVAEAFTTSWGPEESKRDFLDRLFAELPKTNKRRTLRPGRIRFWLI